MGAYQVELGAGSMIGRHEEIRLVLVRRIGGCRLSRRCESLEIELVSVALSVHFAHYVFVVVIPKKLKYFIHILLLFVDLI